MKNPPPKLLAALLIPALLFSYLPLAGLKAQAAVADWQQGANFFPLSNNDYAGEAFRQSVRDLKATGADTVSFVIQYYQYDRFASDIYSSWNTPTDESLISGINYVHSLGMKAVLKPHLNIEVGGWRAEINARDRAAWYRNYNDKLQHVVDIANQTGAEGIVVGSELVSMATYTSNAANTAEWIKMINQVRSRYSGFLTYSANWGESGFAEEVAHIGFWPQLDYIGISAYYELAKGSTNPPIEAFMTSWNKWETTKIKPLYDQFKKPIIFTEVGYRSMVNAHSQPWDWQENGAADETEQQKLYEALFRFWDTKPYLAGVYLWNWDIDPNAGGSGHNGYTPQNKKAEGTMTAWFGQAVPPKGTTTPTTTPPTPGGSTQSGNWTVTGSVPNTSPGAQVNISTQAAISGGASDVVVDLEVYNSSNQKVFQKFFEHENFSAGVARNFAANFSAPGETGNYTLKFGVFNNNWTNNFYWNNEVATFSVGSTPPPPSTTTPTTTPPTSTTTPTTTPPTPGPASLNVWWPVPNALISGVQPFKAMVENRAVEEYEMFWQVDGDRLNQMFNNYQDYPHKEVLVDVSGWSWKGNGPYRLTFVAKDGAGNIIVQKDIDIFLP